MACGRPEEDLQRQEYTSITYACKKECYKKVKVCKKVRVKNPDHDLPWCKMCKLLPKGCDAWKEHKCWKNYCGPKFVYKKKCKSVKVRVKCENPTQHQDAGVTSRQEDSGILEAIDTSMDHHDSGNVGAEDTGSAENQKDGTVSPPDGVIQPRADTRIPYQVKQDSATTEDLSVPSFFTDSGISPLPSLVVDSGSSTIRREEELRALAGGCSVVKENSIATVGLVFFLILTPLVMLRKRKGQARTILAIIVIVLFAGHAYSLPTQNLKPGVGSNDFVQTENAKLNNSGSKILWHFEKKPLQIISKPSNKPIADVIESRHTIHLLNTLKMGSRIQLGLDVPISLNQKGPGIVEQGLGDLRLLGKVRLFTHNSLNLSLGVDFTLPTATADYIGEKNGAFSPKLLVSGSLGPLDLAVNLGVRIRTDETLVQKGFQEAGAGQLFVASGAVRWNIVRQHNLGLNVVSDLFLQSTFDSVTQEEVPLEWVNGFEMDIHHVRILAALGAGMTRGMGAPSSRVLLGLSWNWGNWGSSKCTDKTTTKIVTKWKKITVEKKVRTFVPIPVPVPVPVVVKMPSVYFDTDKAELRERGKKELLKFIQTFHKGKFVKEIRVEGHADRRASRTYNRRLAQKRVNTVVKFLIDRGLPAKMIRTISFGELAPMDGDNLQDNRRVDIRITAFKHPNDTK